METSPDFNYYFDIDTKNGKVLWKDTVSKYHRELAGKEAGLPVDSRGKDYWIIRLNKKSYKRPHIIFWKKYGRMPSKVIDHINGDSLDDRIENLREVSFQVNAQNRVIGRKGRKLPMGVKVSWQNKSGECRYEARIKHTGKYICLGSFATPEEASEAYVNKRKEFLCEC